MIKKPYPTKNSSQGLMEPLLSLNNFSNKYPHPHNTAENKSIDKNMKNISFRLAYKITPSLCIE
jgi:hypothetical protein